MATNEPTTLFNARQMQAILEDIESGLPSDLTTANLGALISKVDEEIIQLNRLRSQTTALVARKQDTLKALNEFMKRVRAGAKSAYGDDSLEYERVGGTRISERKRNPKKAEAAVSA